MTVPPKSPRRSRLPVLIALLVLLVVVVAAVVVVFARDARPSFAEDTPEGVVQRYTQAVVGGEYEAARDWVDSTALKPCLTPRYDALDDVRITLLRTTEREGGAVVEVMFSSPGGGSLFGPGEYRYDDRFLLRRAGAGWMITDVPWELRLCDEETP